MRIKMVKYGQDGRMVDMSMLTMLTILTIKPYLTHPQEG